jgi:hypothetical protein
MTRFDWAVVRCMDGRLNTPLASFLREQGVPEAHDLISLPGGARDLVDPESLASRALAEVSIGLHGVRELLLIQHTDCGAYGGRACCGGSEDADLVYQTRQLERTTQAIRSRHPELQVHPVLIHLRDNGGVEIRSPERE